MNAIVRKKILQSVLLCGFVAFTGALAPISMAEETAVKEKTAAVKQVNINKADAQTIANALVGVGTVKAKAIVKYRDEHGKFSSIDQLKEVEGMSPTLVNNNKSHILLD